MRWLLVAIALAGCSASSDVTRALGARCDRKEDCDERCLVDAPGGLCTLSCLDDGDCPEEGRCADVEGGVCLIPCLEDRDCAFLGPQWGCVDRDALPSGEVKVCLGQ